jgi:ABC-type dipeptide/oligopeptide/nickel transport system permease subunit
VTNAPISLPPLDISRAGKDSATPDGGDIGAATSGWRLAAREFSHNKFAVIGLAALVFFVLFCFVGPLIYRVNLADTNIAITNLPPSSSHLLGTDDLGIDVLAELMKGGQSALEIGFLAAFMGLFIGALWGAISGLIGGVLDAAMMRTVDVFLCIPGLFIVLIVAVRYGASVITLSLIIGASTWLVPARLVRGEVLTLRVRDFVSAARAAGSGRWRLVNRHLLPNALGVIIVNVTFNIADAILLVASLGFLGFGLHYPAVDWGDMLSKGTAYLQDGYWWQVYPVGIAIVAVVMACNLLGDALRDALDVRLRRR